MRLYGASKEQRIAARYIPKNARRVLAKADGVSCVYVYEFVRTATNGSTGYGAVAYRGTAARSEFHYTYRTAEQRNAAVGQFLKSIQASRDFKAKRQAEKAAWMNPLTVGTILYTSWGYDQTNVDFFAVTKVIGRRVWVRKIMADYEETGYMSGNTWPAMPIQFIKPRPNRIEGGDSWTRLLNGEETLHIAQPSGESGVYVKISDSIHAWPESGRSHNTTSYA